MTVRFKSTRRHLTIIGVYAPEEGRNEETEYFYENLQKEVSKWNETDYVIISGDRNARIGNKAVPGVMGTYGENHVNKTGSSLIDFAISNELKINNSFYRKKDIYKFAWSARGRKSIIDYVISNKTICNQVQGVHVYRGADIHRVRKRMYSF